jgi:fumarate reductase flavoprotein subunit
MRAHKLQKRLEMEPIKQREGREEACGKGRQETGFLRRDFLLGAAAVGVAIAGAGPAKALAGSAQQASPAASESAAPKETLTADIVVCGTGSSGMAAAVRAGELGAKVIVLEKLRESFVGGSSAMASMLFAVGSSMTKRQSITTTVDDAYRKRMDYQRCASNARVVRRYLSRSGATVDWLMSQGVEFLPLPPDMANSHVYVNSSGGWGSGVGRGLQTLYAKGRGYSVKFLFETPATELVMRNGKVAGVIATKGNGDRIAIHAPVVIIATGGYASSKEMFERFTVYSFDSLETYGLGGRTGDGINMALSAGAALHLPAAVNFAGPTLHREREASIVNAVCCKQQPLVWVNESARRFTDEGTVTDWTPSGQAISQQRKVFTIADTALFDRVKSQGVWNVASPRTGLQPGKPVPDIYEKINQKLAEPNPLAFKADSIEELAGLMGLDPRALADTISVYNGYAAAGQDLDFDKPAQWLLPLKQPPFYGFSVKLFFYNTMGGLKVDELTRVLAKADGEPIPGLYACGSDAGGIWGHYYDFILAPGDMQGWCSTSGLMAAEDAVQRYLRS